MLPYGRQSVTDDDLAAVMGVLRSDWLTTGPQVTAFEADLVRVTGATACLSASSGTAALHIGYAVAGVGPGDEVVTSPLTFVATASSAMVLGARVVFADIQEDTGNLDPQAAAAALTSRTRVITAVDYAGHPADLDELRAISADAGTLLLEDAAHSIGSTYKGRPVGSLADLTAFSFFPTKNLTTAEGGALATTRPELAVRAARFRTVGMVRDPAQLRYPDEGPWHQEVHALGLNYRLPDVLCALGRSQLTRLADFKARRARIVRRYLDALGDVQGLRLPGCREDVDPMWHLFPVRVLDGRRREIFEKLRAQGIGVQVNYLPVYWHPLFEDLGYRRGACPRAEQYYREEISLPLFADLTEADQDRVIAELRHALGE